MKKFICVLICAAMAVSLCSCLKVGGKDSTHEPLVDLSTPGSFDSSSGPVQPTAGTDVQNTGTPGYSQTPNSPNGSNESYVPQESYPPQGSYAPQESYAPQGPGELPTAGMTAIPGTSAIPQTTTFNPGLTASPTAVPTSVPTSVPQPTPYCNPYPSDPGEARLADAGKRFMDKLTSKPEYASLNLKARYGYPYLICINKSLNCVTVYCVDENGNYTRPFLSMVCSGGNDTPLGIFNTPAKYSWHTLMGPCYGQYCTRIVGGVLFHSVPYYTMHKYDLEYNSYNHLGITVSHGCVRLATNDAKWIYDNCALGTTVVIYNDSSDPGPLGRPTPIHIDTSNLFLRGWDPTDPDLANPWDDKYISGTTYRSMLAQAQYDNAMANGLWNGSINHPEAPTPTPNFTPTPAPTPTNAPTNTPNVTPTPVVTNTPEITDAPVITDDPSAEPSDWPDPIPTDVPSAPVTGIEPNADWYADSMWPKAPSCVLPFSGGLHERRSIRMRRPERQ